MTAEELSEFVTTNLDQIVADLITKNYYIKPKVTTTVLAANYMVTGYMRILDAHGIPQVGLRIKVETRKQPQAITVNNKDIQIGVSNTFSAFELDVNGELNIPLVIGSKVVVHIENGMSRELVVPNTDFDIFSASSSDSDGYGTPAAPYSPAIRRA